MTPLQIATLGLYLATAAAAVALSRKDPRNRPLAWYLCIVVALDMVRLARAELLPATTEPRAGWELMLRHLDVAAYLGAILALPGMAMALFLRHGPGPVIVAGMLVWAWVVGSYPDLRGPALMEFYNGLEVAGLVATVGCVVTWLRSPKLSEDGLSGPILCGLALIAGIGVTTALPRITGGTLLDAWPIVVGLNATILACVLGVQLRGLMGGRERC